MHRKSSAIEQAELSVCHRYIKRLVHIEGTIGRNNVINALTIFKHLFSLIEKLLCRNFSQGRRCAKGIENVDGIIILASKQRECQKRNT